ncbi:hypothetical protein V493_03919 [Pseudogymnoascus sp. VKM F-4281 (FW-2241)]|nr:hypothetical protein V493_03919 [Pseudogymnoascus sp. VKM F-4281 (FW-2241)]
MLTIASDEKRIPPPKSSAKAVNRGGRPGKFPPGEAIERKAAAQKQNRGPKASRPVPGTFQFIPYEPLGTESSLSHLVPNLSIDTDVPLRDANAQRIGVEPTSPGSGLELTPAINDGQAGMPSLSSRDQPKSDEESDESSAASDIQSPSPISSRASYFTDSQADADNEGGVLEDKNTTSEANSPESVRDDMLQLATQLYAFQGCTDEQHEQQDRQHRLHHQRADVDPRCASLADILPIIQGQGIRFKKKQIHLMRASWEHTAWDNAELAQGRWPRARDRGDGTGSDVEDIGESEEGGFEEEDEYEVDEVEGDVDDDGIEDVVKGEQDDDDDGDESVGGGNEDEYQEENRIDNVDSAVDELVELCVSVKHHVQYRGIR